MCESGRHTTEAGRAGGLLVLELVCFLTKLCKEWTSREAGKAAAIGLMWQGFDSRRAAGVAWPL